MQKCNKNPWTCIITHIAVFFNKILTKIREKSASSYAGSISAIYFPRQEAQYTAVLSATRKRVIPEEILKKPVDGITIEGTKSEIPNPNFDLYEMVTSKLRRTKPHFKQKSGAG